MSVSFSVHAVITNLCSDKSKKCSDKMCSDEISYELRRWPDWIVKSVGNAILETIDHNIFCGYMLPPPPPPQSLIMLTFAVHLRRWNYNRESYAIITVGASCVIWYFWISSSQWLYISVCGQKLVSRACFVRLKFTQDKCAVIKKFLKLGMVYLFQNVWEENSFWSRQNF